MKIFKGLITSLAILLLVFVVFNKSAEGQTCSSREECEKLISETEQKLVGVRNQKTTLTSQIQFMDTQIYLTTLKIQDAQQQIKATEEEIETLGGRIEGVNDSLDYLTKLLFNKIKEGYKRRDIPLFNILLDSDNASTLVNQLKYAQIAQENDRRVALQLQQAKQNFENQKDLREQKKVELDNLQATLASQNRNLNSQKADKQRLLTQTQNDERTYQAILAQAQAEFAAIQGIIAGKGTEVEIRQVSKGEIIASVISGKSCNSSGTHVHFTVLEGGARQNPFNHLNNTDYIDKSGGDAWSPNPNGSMEWPLTPPIQFHQGYGPDTWFIRTYNPPYYDFHDGLDISGSSLSTKAVADGTLYKGSYTGNGGCTLPYSKVSHKDSNITTLYLHTYTQ